MLGFWLSQILQVDVFAYEYCGYRWATDAPSEESMYSAARAALACLVDGFKLKPERDIVLFGKSLGSCPSCHLAAKQEFRSVVIVSGLASGARALPDDELYVTDALYFHNIGGSRRRSRPSMMHGTMDEVIAFSNSTDLPPRAPPTTRCSRRDRRRHPQQSRVGALGGVPADVQGVPRPPPRQPARRRARKSRRRRLVVRAQVVDLVARQPLVPPSVPVPVVASASG